MEADIGLIGLAVMGQNLVLNMADHGVKVAVFNRTVSKVDEFTKGPGSDAAKKGTVVGATSLKDFFTRLKRPRKVMLMVKAGSAVDDLIQELLPFLEKGDIVIDGGNSHFTDTERRQKELKGKGISFLGVGISGGEEGARHGPSIMPGGDEAAWPLVEPIFTAIAAKASDGTPCCSWVGSGGAGHYVKMVHNGIEYGDMQLIAESYHLLRSAVGLSPEEMAATFTSWNQGDLASYLIEITAKIVNFRDADGALLLDKIVDVAGQKGTGKWTVVSALDQGQPVTLIAEAVFARCLSALKSERGEASKLYPSPQIAPISGRERREAVRAVGEALYAAKIVSYAQGFMLMRAAAEAMGWRLDFGKIALLWREGCIIRSSFLGKIAEAFKVDPMLKSLLLAPFFSGEMRKSETSWRSAILRALSCGLPVPCMAGALTFFDGFRSERLPAFLIQAQRDFFGAHTYERIDRPRGEFFHTVWS
jgi:6-phosphogluconate dehydrogenase